MAVFLLSDRVIKLFDNSHKDGDVAVPSTGVRCRLLEELVSMSQLLLHQFSLVLSLSDFALDKEVLDLVFVSMLRVFHCLSVNESK